MSFVHFTRLLGLGIWVFLERTRILSGIQFTTHVIEFFVVETKRFVGSTVNSEDHVERWGAGVEYHIQEIS